MPDTDIITDDTLTDTPQPAPEGAPPTPPEASPPPAPEAAPARPHPLEPGGERFEQVYARMRQSERDAMELRERLAALERQAKPAQPTVQFYSDTQLQAAVDQGKITPAQMASQLALQAKELGKTEIRQELRLETRRTEAAREVDQYIDKRPALLDTGSEDFRRVARAAREVAEDMNLDVTDPRVQRRALRETLGTLDRIATVTTLTNHNRQHSDTHAETGRGGGHSTTPAATDALLKTVPKPLMAQWERWGYSRERMLAEAKYIDPKVAKRLASA